MIVNRHFYKLSGQAQSTLAGRVQNSLNSSAYLLLSECTLVRGLPFFFFLNLWDKIECSLTALSAYLCFAI